jgi:hypothetical protein
MYTITKLLGREMERDTIHKLERDTIHKQSQENAHYL